MQYTVRLWLTLEADSAEAARQHVIDEINNTEWMPGKWEALVDNTTGDNNMRTLILWASVVVVLSPLVWLI